MRKFKFHYDAAHGWLKVHKLDLADIRMYPYNFTSFSYRDNDWFYLEEDCDAGKFLAEYDRMFGVGQFHIVEVNDGDESPIRNLPRNHQ